MGTLCIAPGTKTGAEFAAKTLGGGAEFAAP